MAFGLGLVGAGGVLWPLLNARNAARSAEAEQLQVSVATRDKLNAILLELIAAAQEYAAVRDSTDWQHDETVSEHLTNLHRRIDLLTDDYRHIESGLAALEGRPVRPVALNVIRPPAVESLALYIDGRRIDTGVLVKPGGSVELQAKLFRAPEGP